MGAVQARHFKTMMKDAGHLDRLGRMRISDEDLVPLTPAYDVRGLVNHPTTLAIACSSFVLDCPYSAEGVLSAPMVDVPQGMDRPVPPGGISSPYVNTSWPCRQPPCSG